MNVVLFFRIEKNSLVKWNEIGIANQKVGDSGAFNELKRQFCHIGRGAMTLSSPSRWWSPLLNPSSTFLGRNPGGIEE